MRGGDRLGYGRERPCDVPSARFDRVCADISRNEVFKHKAFDTLKDAHGLRLQLHGAIDEQEFDTYTAEQRAVQRTGAGTGNLLTDSCKNYLDIQTYPVRFFVEDPESLKDPIIKGKRYIRIKSASRKQGVAVLPIDMSTGSVQMITQHRFPPNAMLTEAPRGFGDITDVDAKAGALRELREEAELVPIRINAKLAGIPQEEDMILPLAELYTDTGIIADKVGFFLALCDRKQTRKWWAGRRPGVENPVWLPLGALFEAAILRRPAQISLKPEDRIEAWRAEFPIRTELDDGFVSVQDGFTYALLMAARPALCHLFPGLRETLARLEAEAVSGEFKLLLDRARAQFPRQT